MSEKDLNAEVHIEPPTLPADEADKASGVPFIRCENLVKIYQVAELEVVALQGLDLEVASGELLGVVGASGSGKTTLMNILGGLDRPSAGRVWVGEQDLIKLSPGAMDGYRRSMVGFVWQQSARNLVPYLSASENVILPMTLAGLSRRRKHERAAALLKSVGLADRSGHKLSELSGGEQQRAAIAVSLANQPQLLLADEPTGEVDEATAALIYQILHDLNRDLGLTTLIVSHDPGLASHVDRVIAIRDGKMASETVRSGNGARTPLGDSPTEDDTFEELTVLDSAGRLQVPKEYLEQLNFQGRARMELLENGILIKPADAGSINRRANSETRDETPPPQKKRLWSLFRRRKRDEKGDESRD